MPRSDADDLRMLRHAAGMALACPAAPAWSDPASYARWREFIQRWLAETEAEMAKRRGLIGRLSQ